MIKAEELRIGNYVWNDYSGYMVVMELKTETLSARHKNFTVTGTLSYSEISPIPLTPEILVACGFVYVEDYAEYRYRESTNWFGVFNEHNDDWYFDKPEMSTVVIKYLHQLQNLFYALTNTELNYKP